MIGWIKLKLSNFLTIKNNTENFSIMIELNFFFSKMEIYGVIILNLSKVKSPCGNPIKRCWNNILET